MGENPKVDTQTAYALALWIGLLPEETASGAAETLARKIDRNGNRMATGSFRDARCCWR